MILSINVAEDFVTLVGPHDRRYKPEVQIILYEVMCCTVSVCFQEVEVMVKPINDTLGIFFFHGAY